jgi:hypothetical protein
MCVGEVTVSEEGLGEVCFYAVGLVVDIMIYGIITE